jgi:hypothetical protein
MYIVVAYRTAQFYEHVPTHANIDTVSDALLSEMHNYTVGVFSKIKKAARMMLLGPVVLPIAAVLYTLQAAWRSK